MLGDACNGDMIFADSLEAFGGGQDDPLSVSLGGVALSTLLHFVILESMGKIIPATHEHGLARNFPVEIK